MIVDKFFDSVYDVASRYVTHWRIGCFVLAMLLGSDKFYHVIFSEFWFGGAADFGAALVSAITEAPLWIFVVTLMIAFYAAPLISKLVAMKVLESELQQSRVSGLIEMVESAALAVPLQAASEELQLARTKAEIAEKKIIRYKSVLELFTFWVVNGVTLFAMGKASFVVVCIALLWPFLCWRMIPYILKEYIQWIYYYKKLSAKVGSGIF